MKRLLFVSAAVLSSLLCSCSKKNTATAASEIAPVVTITPQTFVLDNTFSNTSDTAIIAMALQSDGKIIVINHSQIKRLNKDGSNDNTFTTGNASEGQIYSMALQPDGKIWVAGNFYTFNSKKKNLVVRLNANGSIDETFVNLPRLTDFANGGEIDVILPMSDGSVMLGGNFIYNYDATAGSAFANGAIKLIRLTSQGAFDYSFSTRIGSGTVKNLTLDKNGRMLVSGYELSTYDNKLVSYYNAFKINFAGTLDATFRLATSYLTLGRNDPVYRTSINALVIQEDGKLLVGGQFDGIGNDQKYQSITRLNADGSLDNTFKSAKNFGNVTAIFKTGDKKTLVGISSHNGEAIAALKDDGSIDNSVSFNFARFGNIYQILPDADGNLLVAGRLNSTATPSTNNAKGIYRIKKQ